LLILVSEDELVSLDDLQEKIAEFEDYVQSSDIAAMQSMYLKLVLFVDAEPSLQSCDLYFFGRVRDCWLC
jgi:hypothetical protein